MAKIAQQTMRVATDNGIDTIYRTSQRQITHVAAGTQSSDAANVGQVQAGVTEVVQEPTEQPRIDEIARTADLRVWP